MLTQWFDPEPCFKGLAFARELQRQGHAVSVLTGFPNYPSGRVYPGYRLAPWQREIVNGIPIFRVPLYPSHDRSAVRRICNYVSFALSSALAIFALPRPDIVYVYSPPPSAALGAVLLRAVKRVPYVLDVQDLWPDALGATGMVRSSLLMGLINWGVNLVHRRAAHVAVLSQGFRRILIERGEDPDRVTVIPNWTHELEALAGRMPDPPSDTFDIVFAGNMGPAQNLDVVLEAAERLMTAAPHVRFVMVGDGVDALALKDKAEAAGLDNVTFTGRLPPDAMPALFARAGALLVHLRDEPVFAITVPSKTQAYLRAGKPILMGVRGDAADLVTDACAGIAFEPGNAAALAESVHRLIALPSASRDAMGDAGARYYRDNLSLETGTRAFLMLFEKVLQRSGRD